VRDGDLLGAYRTTMQLFTVALFGSFVLAVIVGLATGLNRTLRYLTDPVFLTLYSIPVIVFIPLLVFWFGLGDAPDVVIVFLSAFFPVVINTQLGVDQVNAEYKELARSFGARPFEALTKITLPAAIPHMLAGIRIAIPRAFVSIIAAEILVTLHGLGGLAFKYGNNLQTEKYFVPVILLVATSYLFAQMANQLETWLTPWRPRA
jgi:ABC-type nitrate/sulfonate/bicarbonate transport system permease component